MSCYSFKISKDKIELSVYSEDKYFVLMQFNRLYEQLVAKVVPEKQENADKSVKVGNEEKTTKKSRSKKAKSEIMPIKDTAEKIEKTVEAVPEPQAEAAPEKADICSEQEATPEKEAEKAEPKQIVMPEEIVQETTAAKIEEAAKEQEEIVSSPTLEAPEEENETSDVESESESATLEEIFSKEQKEDTTEIEEVIAQDAIEPINEEETEEIVVEPELSEVKGLEMPEETDNFGDDNIEIPDNPTKEEVQNESDFEKIMAKKLMEELEPLEDEDQEEDDEPEADIFDDDEEEDEDEELKETITYYADEEDSSEPAESQSEEEEELAQELNQTFEKEEPAVEVKKNKIYDILQQKLSSLPKAELSRLNLFKFKTQGQEAAKPENLPSFKNFDDLIYLKKPQTKLDYLLVTSYYLQENEAMEKYSLKQINARVIPVLKEAIDHSVIHEAVAHSYLQVVPDTGDGADVTEYAITHEGIDYILNEL